MLSINIREVLPLWSFSIIRETLSPFRAHLTLSESEKLELVKTGSAATMDSSSEKVRTHSVNGTIIWSSWINAVRLFLRDESLVIRACKPSSTPLKPSTSAKTEFPHLGASPILDLIELRATDSLATVSSSPTMEPVRRNGSIKCQI